MKKILLLFVILMSISTSYGQRKSKKQEAPVKKIEYLDIVQILSNKDELKLTQQQVGALTIKNEYIKRDLQNLNSKAKMEEVEKNMHQRELFAGYNNFVNRTLNEDQLESWNVIKKEIAAGEEESSDLKTEMAALDSAYKAELKEVYRKYSKDRKLYYASRNVVRKQYDADKLRIYKKYNQPVEEEGAEGDKVLTLEEIANLYKEYDDYYNEPKQANPLEYLDVKEEYSNETEEITSEEEGEY
ncbi:hypothetical protein [Myroides profundi]|uniref:Uncharacterized protein n=1 Tax=Myroides profundi TaxID=480520 RepID=A0AAJ4W0D7_MYRPR|nr:hypothetical protein [Myroides profundi]AJH13656.1 hypothetical protein MPR_0445 [Myroides profundi]SEP90145.1 hypothetical protein SAMN04488089_10145 [Myroides profundi]